MSIDIELQGLKVDLSVNIPAPEEWGTEDHGEGEWEGTKRDYFALEKHVIESIDKGDVEVGNIRDMFANSEEEKVRIEINGKKKV